MDPIVAYRRLVPVRGSRPLCKTPKNRPGRAPEFQRPSHITAHVQPSFESYSQPCTRVPIACRPQRTYQPRLSPSRRGLKSVRKSRMYVYPSLTLAAVSRRSGCIVNCALVRYPRCKKTHRTHTHTDTSVQEFSAISGFGQYDSVCNTLVELEKLPSDLNGLKNLSSRCLILFGFFEHVFGCNTTETTEII